MTEIKTTQGVCYARLEGDLDHHTASLMRSDIDRELNSKRPTRLIIDFSNVTFMDSSGIGLIMGRYKLMNDLGGSVVVARPPAYIKKVLKLAGIDRLTPIADSLRGIMPEEESKGGEELAEKITQGG